MKPRLSRQAQMQLLGYVARDTKPVTLPDTKRAQHIASEVELARQVDRAIAVAHVERHGNPWHPASRSLRLRNLIQTLSPTYAAALEREAARNLK